MYKDYWAGRLASSKHSKNNGSYFCCCCCCCYNHYHLIRWVKHRLSNTQSGIYSENIFKIEWQFLEEINRLYFLESGSVGTLNRVFANQGGTAGYVWIFERLSKTARKACSGSSVQFSSVQLLSRVWLFVTPWIKALQSSLFITIYRSSLRLTSIESVMPSSHLSSIHDHRKNHSLD